MTLIEGVDNQVSQWFAGKADAEPVSYFINALDGRPLKGYGSDFPGAYEQHDGHKGMDQACPIGTSYRALEAGTVQYVGDDGKGGLMVRAGIRGQANSRWWVTHLSKSLVVKGATIAKGQVIARTGSSGLSTGPHAHTQLEFRETARDGKTRWMAYDLSRFCRAGTFRVLPDYRATAIARHLADANGYLYGATNLFDDRIYPIRQITINANANIRELPSKSAKVVTITTAVTPASQINEVPGGPYSVNGVPGTVWAKVRFTVNGTILTGYVAKPLIKVL